MLTFQDFSSNKLLSFSLSQQQHDADKNDRIKSPRCIKASFYIPENRLNFPTTKGFRTNISINRLNWFTNTW